jgi:hypothetical protein
MNIPMILTYLRPGEEWTLDGYEYTGLTWLSDTEKPTEGELRKAEPAAQEAQTAATAVTAANTAAAIAHAKNLGFTDEMIRVMYPNLGV